VSDFLLQPGGVFAGDRHDRVRTVLGSCVSITLWQPQLRVGAMCHFVLASRTRSAEAPLDGRFADEALELMLQGLGRLGANAQQCEAKLFGGGHMFPGCASPDAVHVGRRNGEAARELLLQHGIPLKSESLFGVGHRRLVFDIGSGAVWAAQLRPADALP
jgi:chemotaxis protein CheD